MTVIDINVTNVQRMLQKRAEVGLAKYGVTTERNDIDLLGWLQHLQEELCDAAVYVERIKTEIKEKRRMHPCHADNTALANGFFEGYLA